MEVKKKSKSPSKKKRDETSSEEEEEALEKGTRVKCVYKGKKGGKDYEGKIKEAAKDGTYSVLYDDGETETECKRKNITVLKKKKEKSKALKKGQAVTAQFKGKGKFYKGKIAKVLDDDEYNVDFDDGDKDKNVARKCIKLVDDESSSDSDSPKKKMSKAKVGQKCKAKYRSKGTKFYPGKVSKVNSDGTLNVAYDDGDTDKNMNPSNVRLEGGDDSDSDSDSPKKKKKSKALKKGQAVTAQFKGKGKFYKGKIAKVLDDDEYNVDFDDGDKDKNVIRKCIKPVDDESSSDSDSPKKKKKSKAMVGQKCKAKYRSKGTQFYPGKVSKVNSDGTLNVAYDDGDTDKNLDPSNVQLEGGDDSDSDSDSPKRKKKSKGPRVGDRVKAPFKGKGKKYDGKIEKDNDDGTFSVLFDDGDKDRFVEVENIEIQGGDGSDTEGEGYAKLVEGDKVEAKYKGKSRKYPGVIKRVRSNGTYDINYDDGEKETSVSRELIFPLDKKSPKKKSKGPRVGDRVKAPFKGKGKKYDGKIEKDHGDGTYSVLFDDGDKDRFVEVENIEIQGGDGSDTEGEGYVELEEGDKVEAKYKGKSRKYPGVIKRVRSNGTYDVAYDDGEREVGVARDLIFPLETKSPSKASKPRVGQKCTAQFKGKGRFYGGTISKINSDGTVNVDFDDGDKDKFIEMSSVKLAAAASDSDTEDSSAKPRVGQRCTAQMDGRGRFYPGKITKTNADGTVNVDFDDGDKGRFVEMKCVKIEKKSNSTDSGAETSSGFTDGQKVEAKFRGKSR